MTLSIGNTFFYKHLYIIISHPFDKPEKIIAVNISTWRESAEELNDPSCIVNIGDHPFIESKSYIYYYKAIKPLLTDLEKAINDGLISQREDCAVSFLEKILEGAAKSNFIPLWAVNVLQQQRLI